MLTKLRQGLADHQPRINSHIQKRASVLIPLLECEGELFVMLTQRSEKLNSHAGQVSFPGGKQDAQDANSLETALRETHEEIGLLPEKVEIIGTLDQILSLHYYLVTPFVGLIPDDFIPVPNEEEIEAVFKAPLSFFMKSDQHWTEEFKTPIATVLAHHFDYEGYDIWGLTSKLILRLLEIGLGHVPDFPVHHPDSPTWMERTLDYSGDELPFDSEALSHSEQRKVH
ncbi:MAG TPA: CoA pyrophosphatase [Candidatus Lambdaproteobacteria bacterium]|jgi:8-oxo-dGTP pyrophosphatase MutT (NUDIX family)|nr:CoA pyrophosphatase [SAR324 cluster bacterium]HBL56431.1 CoA pyrophosphatase [Deltaproteobacteria bacterium]HHZ77879.1 CoA pyrophosphatase [Candidatus Lambdaproteobacteria bacterium]HIA57146.1 CoA pyrophosphatase [Candidatus Lambdaproteobacteria bacterium]HIB46059.1 CoA pyrophosphatase [Candidatus Lambdaproteobacteria bacterium]